MAVKKITFDGHTLIDLTQDTAVESDVASGKTFHKADGTLAVGSASGGGGEVNLQNKTVPLGSAAPSAVSADEGYDGLGTVSFNTTNVDPTVIKSGSSVVGVNGSYPGIVPSGAATLYQNNVVTNVSDKLNAIAKVPAKFTRKVTITFTIYDNTSDPEPGDTDELLVHYRGPGPTQGDRAEVMWHEEGIVFALGTTTTQSFDVYLLPADEDGREDGIYVGPLWDGATKSDVVVTGGSARYITFNSQGDTGSETCYVTLTGTTATIHIDIPEGYR